MYFKKLVPLITLCLFSSLGWSQDQEDVEVINAINIVNKKMAACTNKGDADCAATYYTENAVYIGPNMEPLIGREAIKVDLAGDGSTFLKLQADEIEVFGDTVNELGTYTSTNKNGEVLDIGSYVVIWKKTEDGWKLHWDIFNSNLPAN